MLLFGLALLLVAITARLVVHAAVLPRLQLKVHLRGVRDYGFESQDTGAEANAVGRLRRRVSQFAERFGGFVMKRFPSLSVLSASELSAAGLYDVSPETVHGYRAMGAVGLPGLILLAVAAGGGLSMLKILLVVLSAAAGWMLPSFVIRRRGSARLDEVDRRLPELIDVLIATVEAGMGFTASLALVAERFQGPIGQELRLTMKRQTLGISTQEALEEMADRCDTPSIRAFVRTASRGESLGVSIGPVLRELSSDQRRRQRQSAREKMQKAPVKMIFPLIFLIFPALMIVLLFPAAYSIMENLSGIF